MYKKYIFNISLVSILLLATAWIQLNTAAANTAAPPATVEEFPLPNAGKPRQLVRVNNDLWFTAPGVNAIGRFVYTSTVDYEFTFYTIPTPNSEPYDLVADNNLIWFTELIGNNIGKLHLDTGVIEEYAIPTANSAPTGITVTSDGNVWFVQRDGNKIGKFDPQDDSFAEFSYSKSGALLEDAVSSLNGDVIWFTAPGVQRLGSFTIASAAFFDVLTANFNTQLFTPNQLVMGNQNDPWISTEDGVIGRFKPGTVQFFRWYQVASSNTSLEGLFIKSQGSDIQLWFTGSTSGTAGQLLTDSGGSTIDNWNFPIAYPDGELYGIVTMDDGTVWLTDYANSNLLHWSSPYFLSVYMPIIIH